MSAGIVLVIVVTVIVVAALVIGAMIRYRVLFRNQLGEPADAGVTTPQEIAR
jgi:hypothetical protein